MSAPRRVRLVEMVVSQLTVDPLTNMPIVILRDGAGRRPVPIWIGLAEAPAIASHLEHIEMRRPMTHDLMKTIIGACGLTVEGVEIRDVKDHTCFAVIVLARARELIEIDARPSDAIALALRAGAPIRVARKVIDKMKKLEFPVAVEGEKSRRASEHAGDIDVARAAASDLLGLLADEEFGKWKM